MKTMAGFGLDQIIHLIARFAPIGRFRKFFYRIRGTKIGKNTFIEDGVFIDQCRPDLVTIGDDVSIAPGVFIFTHSGPSKSLKPYYPRHERPVSIKNGAWIGAKVIILPGVTIGESSIVGAGAVVTKSVPPYTMVAGIPAKIKKKIKVVDVDESPDMYT